MKQVFESLNSGSVALFDLPTPSYSDGDVLIRSTCTLMSAGTERMLIDFGRSNLLQKAQGQPQKVADVINKSRTDGLLSTIDAVRNKLSQPMPLGYCNVGEVVAVGSDVTCFKVGDRVASNGPHSELVAVPQNLCALVPSLVTDESATFTIPASIGLQGIRLAKPTLGETFLVSGLGLIGLLTAQLLTAHGCKVLGFDYDPMRCSLAQELGISTLDLSSAVDPISWCFDSTSGLGLDGVLVTAATTSSQPIHLAAQACRLRGRIILVGVTGLQLERDLFYKKELSFQVSCSYGPGRYDPAYERDGHDYPFGLVRWTQQRNFQAVLHALSSGVLRTESLVSHRFSIDDVVSAYDVLIGSEPSLGILLTYSGDVNPRDNSVLLPKSPVTLGLNLDCKPVQPSLGFIGVGNYASRTLVPAFAKSGANLYAISSSSGISPVHIGKKFGFCKATTDYRNLLDDPLCDTCIIATRHNSHAALVQQALAAGKHVFVEKPLCITSEELDSIESVSSSGKILMVGFNRRFSPLLVELRALLLRLQGPKSFVYTCNAGSIPPDHWTQDPNVGGGRLLGEACHFVDLLRHLADSPIESLQFFPAYDRKPCPDTFSLQLRFVDGSIGTVHYFSNGSKLYPKERLEVFADGRVIRLDNYRKLQAWGIPGFFTRRRFSQDKGQRDCCAAFIECIQSGLPAPIPPSEIFEVQRWLLSAVNK